MRSVRGSLNRVTLALVGLALVTPAGWLAVTRAPGAHTAPVDLGGLASVRAQGWWTPVIMAGSITATVLLALWCTRQLSSGFRPFVVLPAPGSTLRTRALEDALTEHAVAITGVARCRTRVLARRKDLHVRLHAWLRPDADPATVLPALTALATHTETSLEGYRVHTQVRFSARSRRGPRVG
ncbi:hypothetical protein HLK59_04755 [Streptomyces sp. S3(2020)]|uniref:hypothetical protein n=1 Tax=Streptomyces sp. S3(2020) TaxID=2732044 RepID=UPI00148A00AD|nr:hypothetical protein [Streptomyces sp. S3(2020)]NNN29675.1 hypothetical protein [Streptomyces sp. S3(2020)]